MSFPAAHHAGASLKDLKESFVSNQTGSSWQEVLFVTIIPSCIGYELYLYFTSTAYTSPSSLKLKLFYEIGCTILPLLALQSSDLLIGTLQSLLSMVGVTNPASIINTSITILSLYHPLKISYYYLLPPSSQSQVTASSFNKSSLLTTYRSTISLSTFIAILLVDFTIFPRKYCKTEDSGYGLMDLGTGSYLFSSAVVSHYSRGVGGGNTSTGSVMRSLIKSTPLLVLGFVRLITTKGLDYQEHTSEYGIHWNFFFTLYFVSALTAVVHASSKSKIIPLITVSTLFIIYQTALSFYGLDEYIYSAPRTVSFFAANREGVLGIVGYTLLYLVAEEIGFYGIWSQKNARDSFKLLVEILFVSWTVLVIMESVFGASVSRRLTNAMYVLWVIANNVTMLTTILLIHITHQKQPPNGSIEPSPIFKSINRNSLVMFILSNLVTGVANLSIDTMNTGEWRAVGVMVGYLMVVCGVAVILDKGFNVDVRL